MKGQFCIAALHGAHGSISVLAYPHAFRPHPGRLNLSTGLVALALLGEVVDLSPAVTALLWAAAFLLWLADYWPAIRRLR